MATALTNNLAKAYAERLLNELGVQPLRDVVVDDSHPALIWARSGLMSLTGFADGAPLMCPLPIAACADGALAALASLAPQGALDDLNGAALLAERGAIAGHTRKGTNSPGGACHLLKARDGEIALNLARDDDQILLPAWLEDETVIDDATMRASIQKQTMHDLIERGRLLGLAVAPVVPPPSATTPWHKVVHVGERAVRRASPRVLDLSSLWAGPLCTHLLQRCGADVIKVESTQRPDGARRGPPQFFDLLNAGKRSVALDLSKETGRAQLRALISQADIVIEASRPRALRQMGIHAETLIDENPGLTWVSLNGYGRKDPEENWIAYGDDAGVAGGLSYLMREACGASVIVGDAIADPLTGLHAALAAFACHQQGGGRLLSLALTDVVRHCVQFDRPENAESLKQRQREWTQIAEGNISKPQMRAAPVQARALGADTQTVFASWGLVC
ncbi:MAG: CoA transferase [Pseudomonadota bacterium]